MKIIEFTPEYIDAVVELERKCFKDGWTKEMLVSAFNGEYFGYLAFESEKLIGFIGCTLGIDAVDLEGVAVLPEHRGKGVGKALIKMALSHVCDASAKAMLLEVRESNEVAIRLYEGLGFTPLSVRKKYYSDGENAVVMIKEL